ncbi:MAG TPA: hypothetical protein VEQ66_17180 [Propionibacteriaceae bacterium]|nr:hypothetical protein [Propionibacteriaceae bacterium]
MSTSAPTAAWVHTGLLVLPLYAALVGYGARAAEPDQVSNPEDWAVFVSTTAYFVEHLLGNVVGGALAIFGAFALGAYLAGSRGSAFALWGMTLAISGHVLFTVPGVVSTFVTPAIGHAYLAGNQAALTIEFSPVLMAVFGLALVLALVGNLLLAAAMWRSDRLPRWPGLLWAAGTVIFYLFGAVLGLVTTGASLPTQPVGAAILVIAGVAIAWRARRQPVAGLPVRSEAARLVGQGSRS